MIINSDADIFIIFNDRPTCYRMMRIRLCVKYAIAQLFLHRSIHTYKNFTCEF